MPHLRARHLEPLIKRALGFSGIVGVVGHRQTGKTTLLEKYSGTYVTLDDSEVLEAATLNPKDFISRVNRPPFGIDECQKCPPLFPVLKEHVRTHKQKRQFLLSGSVRFSSRRAIQESLTGRIINLELLPMTLSEIMHGKGHLKLPDKLKNLLLKKTTQPVAEHQIKKQFDEYLIKGGLPGICFSRNAILRNSFYKTHLETVLNRDLRLIIDTTVPLSSLLELARSLAREQGLPLDWARLRMDTGIGLLTLRKLVSAFESLFLIRLVPTHGGQAKPVIFFEDQGIARFLNGQPYSALFDLVRGLYANLREQWMYDSTFTAELFQFRTRSKALVPLCLSFEGKMLGILPVLDHSPTPAHVKTISAFLNQFSTSIGAIAHSGNSGVTWLTQRILSLPWTSLL